MANLSARQRNGHRLYGASPLRDMNEARHNAARFRPLRASDPAGAAMALKRNVSTLKELVDKTEKVDVLCGSGDSHLLISDDLNPGCFNAKPLYDYTEEPAPSGLLICDVHEGLIALHPDTLILWK